MSAGCNFPQVYTKVCFVLLTTEGKLFPEVPTQPCCQVVREVSEPQRPLLYAGLQWPHYCNNQSGSGDTHPLQKTSLSLSMETRNLGKETKIGC